MYPSSISLNGSESSGDSENANLFAEYFCGNFSIGAPDLTGNFLYQITKSISIAYLVISARDVLQVLRWWHSIRFTQVML